MSETHFLEFCRDRQRKQPWIINRVATYCGRKCRLPAIHVFLLLIGYANSVRQFCWQQQLIFVGFHRDVDMARVLRPQT